MPAAKKNLSGAERRSGADRRQIDADLTGKRDRRRGLESRKPEVAELDMSDSDWSALVQAATAPAK
jgi:hypothetical protein